MNNIFDNKIKQNIAPTYLTGILQARSYRNLRIIMTKALGKYKISMTEWAILGLMYEDSSISLKKIAEILDVKASLITSLIKTLMKKELLSITINQNDKRGREINLTINGLKKVPEIEIILRDKFKKLLNDVSYIDLLTYIRILSIVANTKQV